ncbi:unnamed protein product [Brachionus calyciflorus]|uniref:EF-hand domain-containing protein n=1 Tax=Brachionus calyciflorus TaxID=104777 RepID=A0A813WYU8_9BILA|nr:unnamed protein product [Brachionus calyciflorus]
MPSNQKYEIHTQNLTDTSSSNQSQYTFEQNPSYSELSRVESIILRSKCPLTVEETEEISVLGQRGIWINKSENLNWNGPIPLSEYKINEDPEPEIITKKACQNLVLIQELAIRYLKPPTPPKPGDIIIRQEETSITPPAPPLIIRQQPLRPSTPDPLVVREAPPEPPKPIPKRIITISGKKLPPPPRKVIIERLAPIPPKPQSVIIERWLPYSAQKRRVVYQKIDEKQGFYMKPKNVIVQWEAPEVTVKKDLKYLGIIRANPLDYVKRYGSTLKSSKDLPEFVLELKSPNGIILAADCKEETPQLEGDVEALKLIDLEKEGLSEYKIQLEKKLENTSSFTTQTMSVSNAYFNQVYSTASLSAANFNISNNSMNIISEVFNQIDVEYLKIDQAERLYNKLCMRLGRLFNRDQFRQFLLSVNMSQDGTISLREFRRVFENFL